MSYAILTIVLCFNTVDAVSTSDIAQAERLIGIAYEMSIDDINYQFKQNPNLLQSMKKISYENEVLDDKESSYYFAKSHEFGQDSKIISARFVELRFTPFIQDAMLKIKYSNEELGQILRFNYAVGTMIKTRAEFYTDKKQQLEELLLENEYYTNIVDCMRDIKSSHSNIYYKRRALQKLINLIGEDNYRDGVFKTGIPSHLFVEIP